MADPQTSEIIHSMVSDLTGVADANPSFQRASVLFVTSLGSLIAASLLLASL
ncbi:hypothetical protein [Microvirga zambiensis]|uniref:hypothetical protein n=1 Tax=Microvirga zambiensis TaxID=1402137 RepID=UPI00191D8626|nr:hypothetical protein [Microvirga zambiensis]